MSADLIFASANKHKIQEVQNILGNEFQLLGLRDINFQDNIKEDGKTFQENALIKAKTISKQIKDKIIIADDSGLVIAALNGRPGILSARYAGAGATKEDLCKKILAEMKGIPQEKRQAKFICSAVAVFPDGKEIFVEGMCEGIIAHRMKGEHGFGYDPIFYLLKMKKTMAELLPEEKNKISHRFKAFSVLAKKLKKHIELSKE